MKVESLRTVKVPSFSNTLAQLHQICPASVQVTGPALTMLAAAPDGPCVLVAAPEMFSAMPDGRLSAPETVPPLQFTAPVPVNLLMPATVRVAMAAVFPPLMASVVWLNMPVAPMARLVPAPCHGWLPLKKKLPLMKSKMEPALVV